MPTLPIQLGGGPSRSEAAFQMLRDAVGVNGSSSDENEIETLWRLAKADGLASLEAVQERAVNQASPYTASDTIPLYEQILGITPDEGSSDEQRRRVIIPDYAGVPEAWFEALQASLQRIDAEFTVRVRPWENCSTTMIGRWYEPSPSSIFDHDTYDSGAIRKGTSWPSYSDVNAIIIELPLADGVAPSAAQRKKIERAKSVAADICPAWTEFHVIHTVGFTLDTSLLDATAFGT
jgi:hypothetical protein